MTNDGVDLNQALINYGLQFLRERGYKKTQAPFMVKKDLMAATAQLEEFDEALYKVSGNEDMYLIATSEQPISAMFSDENIEPSNLPIQLAGYSTCFRKEAGKHGKDTWGIFRVHQFEKVEQVSNKILFLFTMKTADAFSSSFASQSSPHRSLIRWLMFHKSSINPWKSLIE